MVLTELAALYFSKTDTLYFGNHNHTFINPNVRLPIFGIFFSNTNSRLELKPVCAPKSPSSTSSFAVTTTNRPGHRPCESIPAARVLSDPAILPSLFGD